MKYKYLDKLGIKLSILGFGSCRFPTGVNDGDVIINKTEQMLSYAFDHGVNIIDTGYDYHDFKSENIIGNVLKNGYRDKVYLSTKLPAYRLNDKSEFDSILNNQLNKLKTDCIDFYLLHGLSKNTWEKMKSLNALEWMESKKSEGKIKYIGFSFHDSTEILQPILDSYDWDMVMLQYNYVNEKIQAGTKGIKYASSKSAAITIMEPLLGGNLVNFPASIMQMWHETKKDPVYTALNWLWSKSEISTVFSGMSTFEQVKNNIKFASYEKTGKLAKDDLGILTKVKNELERINPIPCTGCKYCLSSCPIHINIPELINMYNYSKTTHNELDWYSDRYSTILNGNNNNPCIKCKKCEEICTQKIEVIKWMQKIHNYYTQN